ncbi:MAG: tetratricopeptide repeat protein [Candidatus Eisenbacteria bacterium]
MNSKTRTNSETPPSRATTSAGPSQLVLNGSQEAEKVLEELAAQHPTYADVRYRLGLLKLAQGRHASAQREFEEALGIHPGYRGAYYALRLSHVLQGKGAPGERGDIAGESPREEWIWATVDRAYALWASGGDPLQAFEGEGRSGTTLHHHYGAVFALRGNDRGAAETHLRSAASLSTTSAAILRTFGYTPENPGNLDGLARHLEGLLWSPLAADLYCFLGRIYARNGLREESLRCYDRAHLVLPDDARYCRHQAEVAVAFGEEEEAIRLFSRAVELDPDCVETRVALGFEYAAQGFLSEACAQFERAVQLAPGYADVRYNLGLLYAGEERNQDAVDQFRRALALNPAYLPARRNLAALLHRMEQYEEALREADRILRQGYASADLYVQMALDHLALERPDEALDHLLKAETQDATYAPTFYWLGQVYRRMGRKNKARSAWSRYLDRTGQGDAHGAAPVACDREVT